MFEELSPWLDGKVLLRLAICNQIGGVDSWTTSWSGGGYYESNISKDWRDICKEMKIRVILTVDGIIHCGGNSNFISKVLCPCFGAL
jgi:hypothetical protein